MHGMQPCKLDTHDVCRPQARNFGFQLGILHLKVSKAMDKIAVVDPAIHAHLLPLQQEAHQTAAHAIVEAQNAHHSDLSALDSSHPLHNAKKNADHTMHALSTTAKSLLKGAPTGPATEPLKHLADVATPHMTYESAAEKHHVTFYEDLVKKTTTHGPVCSGLVGLLPKENGGDPEQVTHMVATCPVSSLNTCNPSDHGFKREDCVLGVSTANINKILAHSTSMATH